MAPDIATLEDAARRWPQHSANSLSADDAAIGLLADLREAKAQFEAAEEEKDALELALTTRMEDCEALTGPDGKPLCTWKTQASTRLDTAAIKAAGLYETYAKTTTSRVFRLPAPKKENA